MIHVLKNWWKKRRTKHYLKSHWHLILDIILVVVILLLITTVFVVRYYAVFKINTTPIKHIAKEEFVSPIPGSLIIKLVVSKTNIYSGETISLKIHLENDGKDIIKKLELTPRLLSDGFTISKLVNTNALSEVKVNGRKLILENLLPSDVIDAEIFITLNAEPDSLRIINWRLNSAYQEAGENHTGDNALASLKLITDLKIKAEAYYNSSLGDQLGSGPIPPLVGFPTNYWIFFEVDNKGNDLSGLTVSAKLPVGVTLSNHKTLSAGEFTYNESQKRLTWLVKEASIKNERYQVGFEIQLIPGANQLNTSPLLVSNISYLATDVYTGEKLSGKLSAIDTELPLDTINRGQGTVTN